MQTGIGLAKEYVKKYAELPTLTIAKMLYKNYNTMFANLGSCRGIVQRARGVNGSRKRDTTNIVQTRTPEQIQKALGISAIKPDLVPFKVVDLVGARKWFFLPDPHIPYHSLEALETAVNHAKKERCDGLALTGDFVDFYKLSTFVNDPGQRSLLGEITMAKKMLYELVRLLKPSKLIWKLGNHEHRLARLLMLKTPELFGLPFLSFDNIFELPKLKVDFEVVRSRDLMRYKTLTIGHGDEIGNSSSDYPAKGVYMRTGACTYVSHWHRSSTYTTTNIEGDIKTCWSSGCLCQLHPDFAVVNKWNHGFGILETKGKYWEVKNKSIIKGRVFEG